MKRFFRYLAPNAPMMSLGFLIKAVGTVMELFIPWVLSEIIDNVIPTRSVKRILLYGGMMLLASVIAVSFNIIANRMASRVAGDCTRAIRHDLFAHISYLDAAQVDEFTVSSLESRLTVDTYNVHQMIGMLQRLGVRAPLLLLGGITVTFIQDVRLTLVMLATLPFILISMILITRKGIPLYTRLQQAIDNMTRVIRENASGVRVIKALRKSEYEKQRFDAVNRDAIRREKAAGITMAVTNPLVTLFLNFGLVAVVAAGAILVNRGLSSTGKIIAFMNYFTIITNALISLSRMFTVSSKGIAGIKRINRVLEEEPALWVDGDDPGAVNPAPKEGVPHIRFDHVTFSYQKDAKTPTLSDISFELAHGQTLGVIGATGSGKSTLIALLLRSYDADAGKIEIDGVDLRKIPTLALRRSIGVVFQNDFVFADTLAENIRFGRPLTDEQVEAALASAQADYVKDYPDGTAHRLDIKGANLSGGQRQRLLIARALAASPDLLILDDSSSALDYRTDAALRKEIACHFGGATKMIIAQRISSIRHADHILMLDQGKILGYGDHESLLRDCAAYREICEAQMGGGFCVDEA